PPASLVAGMAIGWVYRNRRPLVGRSLMMICFVVLVSFSMPIVGTLLLRCLEPDPPYGIAGPLAADAIVLLGGDSSNDAAEYGSDTIGPLSLERIRYAAWLQHRTGLPLLVTGGPLSESGAPISKMMQEVLTG